MLAGLAAQLIWGTFPLFWPLLEPAGALEIVAHRIVWSLVTVSVVLTLLRRWPAVRAVFADRRTLGLLSCAAVLIAVNWLTYVYAVNSGNVVESSLGYFLTPLVMIAFGVILLRERMRRVQWAAAGLGLVSVVVLTASYGRLPWIAITLALSFGTYGLVKKRAGVDPLNALAVETAVLAPIALGYLMWSEFGGTAAFGHVGLGTSVLMLVAGPITTIPLLLFGVAANRIPLTWMGLLQYVNPVLQLAVGVGIRHELMPAARWAGFVLIWFALVLITLDSAVLVGGGVRRRRRAASEGAASETPGEGAAGEGADVTLSA